MTTALVLEIMDLVLALGQAQENKAPKGDAAVAITLVQIIQKGAQAYAQHMGQPVDLSQINVENAL